MHNTRFNNKEWFITNININLWISIESYDTKGYFL